MASGTAVRTLLTPARLQGDSASQFVATDRAIEQTAAGRPASAMPAHPSTIPVHRATDTDLPLIPMQRKLAIGSTTDPLETEAEAVAARAVSAAPTGLSASQAAPALSRHPTSAIQAVEAPPIVHEALGSPGRPLDVETRAFMEPRMGHDLSAVRIHTGPRAEESARAVHALAYTVGQDAVFAAGQYNPRSREGRRLLAHELSHTIQQADGGRRAYGPSLSGAAPTLQRQPIPQAPPQSSAPQDTSMQKPKTDQATINISWDDLLHNKLTPPSILAPKQQPLLPSPGTLTLGGSQAAATPSFGLAPSTQASAPQAPGTPWFTLPPSASPAQQQPLITPPGLSPLTPPTRPGPLAPIPGQASGTPAGAGPPAPSRVSLFGSGNFSFGARVGFPDIKPEDKPGVPPSAAQEAIRRSEILGYILTGQVPSAYQLDPGKLVGTIWGIFSTRIAPDIAKKIAASVSSKPAAKGPSYELDAVILISTSGGPGGQGGGGGGLSITVKF